MLFLPTATLTSIWIISCIGTVVAHPNSSPSFDPAHYAPESVLTRDVCVIGGGSSGVYTAIRTKDSNKSVVVVEQKGRLGGHTETYTDPITGLKADYGVEVWHDLDIVKGYFARFNVSLVKARVLQGNLSDKFIDLRTGKAVQVPSPNVSEGLAAYAAQVAKYPYLEAGFFLPDSVPPDLLLPFGKFVEQYPAIKPAVLFIAGFAQGVGDILELPTLYVFKYIGLGVLRDAQLGFLVTERGDNSELYEKAEAELGKNVLLNSRVIATQRQEGGTWVKVVVRTPSGLKLIQANKIVITIPPQPRNLRGFDLGKEELSLFQRFSSNGYYTGLLRRAGLPTTISVANAEVNTPYNIPRLPRLYGLSPSRIPGLIDFKYGSEDVLSDAEVKANIIADVERLRTAGTFNTTKPEFEVFSSHSPFELTVSTKDIANGFYRKLYALQGKRNTYYTGAAFHSHDSSLLWAFTEANVIPGITTD
jgi:hypothetical protein